MKMDGASLNARRQKRLDLPLDEDHAQLRTRASGDTHSARAVDGPAVAGCRDWGSLFALLIRGTVRPIRHHQQAVVTSKSAAVRNMEIIPWGPLFSSLSLVGCACLESPSRHAGHSSGPSSAASVPKTRAYRRSGRCRSGSNCSSGPLAGDECSRANGLRIIRIDQCPDAGLTASEHGSRSPAASLRQGWCPKECRTRICPARQFAPAGIAATLSAAAACSASFPDTSSDAGNLRRRPGRAPFCSQERHADFQPVGPCSSRRPSASNRPASVTLNVTSIMSRPSSLYLLFGIACRQSPGENRAAVDPSAEGASGVRERPQLERIVVRDRDQKYAAARDGLGPRANDFARYCRLRPVRNSSWGPAGTRRRPGETKDTGPSDWQRSA